MSGIEDLIILAQNGDIEARNALIVRNLGVIRKYARLYSSFRYSYEDLTNEGVIASIKAVNKYDITKGFKLSTIIGRYVRNRLYKVVKRRFLINGNEVNEIIDEYGTLEHYINREYDEVQLKTIYSIISRLKPYQQDFIKDRYWDSLSLEQIANKYNISRQAVFCREKVVLRKINKIFEKMKGSHDGTYS